jgi:hypothetical protein
MHSCTTNEEQECFVCLFVFEIQPGYIGSGTHYPPTSASQALALQACITASTFHLLAISPDNYLKRFIVFIVLPF